MTRLFVLLLTACILLTACSQAPAPTTEPALSQVESTQATEPKSTQIPEPTSTQATEPMTLPIIQAQPNPSYEVTTDFDHYTKAPSWEEKYTRLSPDPILDLEPTKNEKQIYPFVDEMQIVDYVGDQCRYGLVDADGCILTDTVYSKVEPLINRDTRTVVPIWVLEKTTGEIPEDQEYYFYIYGEQFYGLAAMDGSFVVPCVYESIYCNDGRIIAFRDSIYPEASIAFDLYDLFGNLLLRSEELSFANRLRGDTTYYTYGQGLYSVAFENPTEDPQRHGFNYDYYGEYQRYLMNEAGELVAGPFYDIVSLTDKSIAVMNAQGYYVYLDEAYEPLPDVYHRCSPFQNGAAVVAVPWDTQNDWGGSYYRLIDENLQTVLESEDIITPIPDGNFGVQTLLCLEGEEYENGYMIKSRITVYTPTGEVLQSVDYDYDDTWNCEFLASNLVRFFSYDKEVTVIENLSTGANISFPDWFTDIWLMGDPADPILMLDYYNESTEKDERVYLTEDLQQWKPGCTPYELPYTAQPGQVNYPGLALTEEGSINVYTKAHEVSVSYPSQHHDCMELYPNGAVAFWDDTHTRIYNANGELFFSYSIAIMDD